MVTGTDREVDGLLHYIDLAARCVELMPPQFAVSKSVLAIRNPVIELAGESRGPLRD